MEIPRCSGIILHPTSLPGPYGVGVLGKAAYAWVDFLQESRQTIWQVLPLGPTGYGDSPYQSFSTFAGNPYLICLETLVEQGLLDPAELAGAPPLPDERVDFGALYEWKLPLFFRAAAGFVAGMAGHLQEEFQQFCTENVDWLDDYSLFMALKDAHGGAAWNSWAMPLRSRDAHALAAARTQHAARSHAYRFIQWLFFRQWRALKEYANQREIRIVGDIPIYVSLDSADAWSNPRQFFFDDEYQPTVVAGVPPDYFSATGQLWGNPIYRWAQMEENGFLWWIERIRASLSLYDIVRIDHFRGFAGYWEVPAGETTAINGEWVTGPGAAIFEAIGAALGELPIIAEDLGEITPDVITLRDRYNLPGMKILQFAFASDAADKFLPHNYTPNFIVYSGTHDNDTAQGWYQHSSAERERDHLRRYFRTDGGDVAWTLLEAAWRSVAQVAVVPLQDVLNLGTEARMNLPGTSEGNWQWRLQAEQLDRSATERLREATILFGRNPKTYEGKESEEGGQ